MLQGGLSDLKMLQGGDGGPTFRFPPKIAVSGGRNNDVQGGIDSQMAGLMNVFLEGVSCLGFSSRFRFAFLQLNPRLESTS